MWEEKPRVSTHSYQETPVIESERQKERNSSFLMGKLYINKKMYWK